MVPPGTEQQRSYLVEFKAIGSSVKVSAIDPVTLLEVSIVGPTTVSEAELSRLAVRKLEYMLRKQAVRSDTRSGIKA
ncbi:MAG: serine hydroxymethyltransferase [Proteobacteria bacterium]|nr:serine hydroxymethyltransferase [Pseudomonadota bacterium]